MPNGKPIDLQPFFFRFTLETTTFLLFGRNLDVLDGNAADSQNAESSFAAAFDQGQDYLARRGRLGGLYWLIDSLNFRRQCKIVHQYIDDAVLTALHAQATEDTKAAYTILGGLMKETRDPNVLRDQCLNVLLAGRDTTACLLSWTLYVNLSLLTLSKPSLLIEIITVGSLLDIHRSSRNAAPILTMSAVETRPIEPI